MLGTNNPLVKNQMIAKLLTLLLASIFSLAAHADSSQPVDSAEKVAPQSANSKTLASVPQAQDLLSNAAAPIQQPENNEVPPALKENDEKN